MRAQQIRPTVQHTTGRAPATAAFSYKHDNLFSGHFESHDHGGQLNPKPCYLRRQGVLMSQDGQLERPVGRVENQARTCPATSIVSTILASAQTTLSRPASTLFVGTVSCRRNRSFTDALLTDRLMQQARQGTARGTKPTWLSQSRAPQSGC